MTMLRKGDIEDLLKAMGKDIKCLNWKEKINFYLTPYILYVFSWLFLIGVTCAVIFLFLPLVIF